MPKNKQVIQTGKPNEVFDKKTGRPLIPIDGEQVFKLAIMGATNPEIGDMFNCCDDTIERRFAGELKRGRAQLKGRVRRSQLRIMEDGNAPMAIWLGKQVLSQQDKIEITTDKGAISDQIQDFNTHLKDQGLDPVKEVKPKAEEAEFTDVGANVKETKDVQDGDYPDEPEFEGE